MKTIANLLDQVNRYQAQLDIDIKSANHALNSPHIRNQQKRLDAVKARYVAALIKYTK